MSDLLIRRRSEVRDTGKNPYYDWMHPSWRDLIIEYLARNPKARFDFLRCCGPHGIQLALSWGGGVQGERQRPLLDTTEDWHALRTTIKAQIINEQESEVHAILSSIVDATVHEAGADEEAEDRVQKSLHEIAQDVTLLLRERWDKSKAVIPVETLHVYCQLSETLDPLPPMPQLVPTWNFYWTAAQEDLALDPVNEDLQTYRIGKWIDLIQCISGSEPRFLAHLKFPSCSTREVQQFLENIDTYFIQDEADLKTRRDYESEIEILSELKIVNRLGEVIPSLKEETSILLASIASKQSRLEDDLAELFPEPTFDGADLKPSSGISIEEVLSDL